MSFIDYARRLVAIYKLNSYKKSVAKSIANCELAKQWINHKDPKQVQILLQINAWGLKKMGLWWIASDMYLAGAAVVSDWVTACQYINSTIKSLKTAQAELEQVKL